MRPVGGGGVVHAIPVTVAEVLAQGIRDCIFSLVENCLPSFRCRSSVPCVPNDFLADVAISGLLRLDGAWHPGEIGVSAGKIIAVTAPGEVSAMQRIDVGSSYLLPGMVDAHVHCLSEPGEGIRAATTAAAAGGVTTIVEMPYDSSGPINSVERLQRKQALVAREAMVDVALLATVQPGGGWKEASALVDAGACGFKISLFDTDEYRFPRIDDAELLDVFSAIAKTGVPVCVHAENNEIIKTLIQGLRDVGATAPLDHLKSRPSVSETQGVLTAIESVFWTGVKLHLCHVSLPRSVELVERFAQDGLDVSIETCPHYLTLTSDDMAIQGGRLKINPPIRDERARAGLWQCLRDGAIDIIASDHAPWPIHDKTHEVIFDNHSGAPGVETIFPLILAAAEAIDDETFDRALMAMTANPAKRFGMGHRKGQLVPGYDADIVVFDPNSEWLIDETKLHSNAGWSPYHGRISKGRIALTVVRGMVVYDGERVLDEPRGAVMETRSS
jgi:allantoinase